MKPSQHNDWRDKLPMLLLMLGPVLYLAAVLASGYEDGMNIIELMGRFAEMVERPFSLRWTGHTLKFMLGAVIAYGVTVLFLFSTKENKRTGEEHGSAQWGSARQLDRKYRDKDPERNTVLTQHVSMSLDGRKHRRNLLQIVVGGSGSGKTRFFAKPNLMEANCSYVVCDPKGEMLRSIAPLLLEKGYVVKVFDLIDTEHSNCFNPFAYLHDDKDVMKMVNNLIKNTTPKDAQQNDPFWERSEIALDTAIILYLIHEAPPEEQTLDMVLYKYISEMLGKQTIKVQSSGQTKGRNGSMSINYQTIGRELMTPDEVRAMDNRYALLFIRGEHPVMDQKLDILKHRNLKYTEDGGAAPYVHRPDMDYTLDDLAFMPENIETIEIIEIIDDLEE